MTDSEHLRPFSFKDFLPNILNSYLNVTSAVVTRSPHCVFTRRQLEASVTAGLTAKVNKLTRGSELSIVILPRGVGSERSVLFGQLSRGEMSGPYCAALKGCTEMDSQPEDQPSGMADKHTGNVALLRQKTMQSDHPEIAV